jgi:putative cell wall-binding protein
MTRLMKTFWALLALMLTFTLGAPFCSKVYAASQCPVYRLSGADRYKTAAAICRYGWTSSDYVIIATGEGDDKFADALAGSPLAYALNAPMLLTTTNMLNTDTRDEIMRLGAKKAIILGGTGVVSAVVESQLKNDMGLLVERLWGKDRYATSVKIAERIKAVKPFTKAFLTTGDEFQYAMMISPFAAHNYMPILFSQKSSLNTDTKAAISALGIKEVEIIGNTGVISMAVEMSLQSVAADVTRVFGSDMNLTNINVAKKYTQGVSWLAIARDDVFADGLAGAPLAARSGVPVILVGKSSVSTGIDNYINSFNAEGAYIFGGVGAVSDYIISKIRDGKPDLCLYGNTNGNLNNGGIAAIQNGIIYYVNGSQDNKLYKIITIGTGRTKLSDDRPWNINVVGNWVYYTNFDDNNKIYKIRTDGTCRTKLNDDSSWDLRVVDNWIYYTKSSDPSDPDNKSIYRIGIDGTFRTKLNSHESMFLNAADGWIYYLNLDDSRKIYKLKADGTSDVKVSDKAAYYMVVSGGNIYFNTFDEDNKIYKMNTNGTGLTKLSDDKAICINKDEHGDYLYYTNNSDNYSMYKIMSDGTGRVQSYNGSSSLMNILHDLSGDWIYFSHDMEGLMLYKIRTDGTGLSPVN